MFTWRKIARLTEISRLGGCRDNLVFTCKSSVLARMTGPTIVYVALTLGSNSKLKIAKDSSPHRDN